MRFRLVWIGSSGISVSPAGSCDLTREAVRVKTDPAGVVSVISVISVVISVPEKLHHFLHRV